MARAVNDYEKRLLQLGHIVAVLVGRHFRCWQCESGELTLTRTIDAEGKLQPAMFTCDACEVEILPYPDKGGGVQPSLKMNMKGKGFSADQPGSVNNGQWR